MFFKDLIFVSDFFLKFRAWISVSVDKFLIFFLFFSCFVIILDLGFSSICLFGVLRSALNYRSRSKVSI